MSAMLIASCPPLRRFCLRRHQTMMNSTARRLRSLLHLSLSSRARTLCSAPDHFTALPMLAVSSPAVSMPPRPDSPVAMRPQKVRGVTSPYPTVVEVMNMAQKLFRIQGSDAGVTSLPKTSQNWAPGRAHAGCPALVATKHALSSAVRKRYPQTSVMKAHRQPMKITLFQSFRALFRAKTDPKRTPVRREMTCRFCRSLISHSRRTGHRR
mmetsp:Transcript_12081/g.31337  ORF Transcript_12081/g.31337 Transcript_12081/m.31337 type:complete len:210 (-) Transcript_12081:479-1108(-)